MLHKGLRGMKTVGLSKSALHPSRPRERGASVVETVLIISAILLAAFALPSITEPYLRAADELMVAGGGSTTNNGTIGAIVERDCGAAAANGIILDGCPCGTPDLPACPAFTIEIGRERLIPRSIPEQRNLAEIGF